MRIRFAWTVLTLVFLTGCASMMQGMQVSHAKNDMQKRLDPLVGHSANDVVMTLGAPTGTDRLGDFEVWHYYRSYGTRTAASVTPNPYYTNGRAAVWEAYDKFDLYFRDGVMVKWDGYVQR